MSACQTETETAGIVIKSLLTTLSPWRKVEGEAGGKQLLVVWESVKQEEKAAPNISESTVIMAEHCCLRWGTMLSEAYIVSECNPAGHEHTQLHAWVAHALFVNDFPVSPSNAAHMNTRPSSSQVPEQDYTTRLKGISTLGNENTPVPLTAVR